MGDRKYTVTYIYGSKSAGRVQSPALRMIVEREKEIEDRKDKRTRIAGSQQSAMIDQRQNDLMPTNFERQSQEGTMPTA